MLTIFRSFGNDSKNVTTKLLGIWTKKNSGYNLPILTVVNFCDIANLCFKAQTIV